MSSQTITPPQTHRAGKQTATPRYHKAQHAYASDSAAYQHGVEGSNGTAPRSTRRKKDKRQPQQIPIFDGTTSPRPSTSQTRVPSESPAPTASTPMKQAYAGPTFHASPAASSLPKPKFFSKSVPSATATSALQARLDADPSRSDAETPSPESETSTEPVPPQSQRPPVARQESPLDLFFNADRAERARLQSPPAAHSTPSLFHNSTSRPSSSNYLQPAQSQRPVSGTPSGKQMFQMEVDGNADVDYESSDWDGAQQQSSVRVPFTQRLRGHGTTASPIPRLQAPSSHHVPQHPGTRPQVERNLRSEELLRQTQSQALKRMLMLTPSGTMPAPDPPVQQQNHQHARLSSAPVELPAAPVEWPASAGQSVQSNGYHASPDAHRRNMSPEVKNMEADLKRMLRLG